MPAKKVLVADDTKNIVQLIRYNLQKLGFDVIEAGDGEAAIAAALTQDPDLIILDVNMPKKDGFQVCRELRGNKDKRMVPIIIVSSRSTEYDKLTGYDLGADDYLTKPFRVDELMDKVTSLIAGKRTVFRVSDQMASTGKNEQAYEPGLGDEKLDQVMGGRIPVGSNLIILGQEGSGRSTICRKFIANGILAERPALFVSVGEMPEVVIKQMDALTKGKTKLMEAKGVFGLVSALNLQNLKPDDFDEVSKVIVQAGVDIGQSIHERKGGIRAIDSVSEMMDRFGEQQVVHFLSQLVHTASAFGGVTTIFTADSAKLSPQQKENLIYLMDGVVELKIESGGVQAKLIKMRDMNLPAEGTLLWKKA